ncbi:TOG array regulator of axonemal microtubules protein 1-like isoform X2 [Gouania willdenowi]|uniref:TOG array regulator of axonemal microtubules protein 1-like isoform X2 n=1 Tax=Gouania willdenowi TaxID=441366 RepID=UPI00105503C7|nr:TOG array regulator of axonemal microtubules protein 1-like isoform X2 [Gouania willdenowi]
MTMMIPALISHEMHQQLLDRKNCWNRTYGVEKLKRVLSEVDIKSVPCESIEEFIYFLPGLLEDSNFKVMFSTLQVLNLLVQKLDTCANRYFERIILVALKALGDPRTITRNEYLNVFRQLMKTVPPQSVLDLVIGYLKHKNPRVREDVLNVIMVAILSHPEIEFDIPKLCSEVAPCLVDNKRKVRHFAFELFALFDHCLGSGRKLPFINAVEKVEKNEDAEGLMAAVEARRVRHALPKLSSDGTLEYGLVLVIPRQRGSLYFASEDDMDWVMDGPRVSSARSHRSKPDSERLHGYGSLGSLTDDLPPQRRIASAGKGKNKLPSEKSSLSSTENEPQPSNTPSGKNSQQVESRDIIVQPRQPEAYVPSFGSGEPLKSNSAAKKRAKANSSSAGLDSLDAPVRADFGGDSSYTSPERISSGNEGALPSLSSSFSGFKASPGKSYTSERMHGASEKLSVSMDFSSLQDDVTLDVGVVGQKVTCTAASTSSPEPPPLPKQTFFIEWSPTVAPADDYSHVQPEIDYQPSKYEVEQEKRRNGRPRQGRTQPLILEQLDDQLPEVNQKYSNSMSDESTLSPTSPIKGYTPTPPPQPSPPTVHPSKHKSASRLRRSHSCRSQPSPSPGPDKLTHVTKDVTKTLPEALEYSNHQKPDMALELMSSDDWEQKKKGMTILCSLIQNNPDVIRNRLHECCQSVMEEMKNNRSVVLRLALSTLGDMYTHLQNSMDCELEETVKLLLKKAGDSNSFIRQDADAALDSMVQHCTPSHCLHALLAGGLNDRNKAVRNCAAQHLADLVTKIGAARIVSGGKDIAGHLIPAICKLAQDASPEARFFGRQMLLFLSAEPKFNKVLDNNLATRELAAIRKIVNTVMTKGLNNEPIDPRSARGRRPQMGNETQRGPTLNREPVNKTNSHYSSKAQTQTVADKNQYIEQLSGLMGSKDFKVRIQGINQIVADSQNNPKVIISNIHVVFDAISARLTESNSKVNLHALMVLPEIICVLEENMAQVVNTLVPAIVDNHLNSKNNPIYCAAVRAIDALISNLDNTHLLQIFCNKAKFLNGKAKADLIDKVAAIVTNIGNRKPQMMKQRVLPLLWHLLGISTHSSSIHNLCNALYNDMGSELTECAMSQPLKIRQTLNKILSSLQ